MKTIPKHDTKFGLKFPKFQKLICIFVSLSSSKKKVFYLLHWTDKIPLSDCLFFLRYLAIYCYYLLSSQQRHKFCNQPKLSNQTVFLKKPKKSGQKYNYLKKEKGFSHEIKRVFIIFKSILLASNCLRPKKDLL